LRINTKDIVLPRHINKVQKEQQRLNTLASNQLKIKSNNSAKALQQLTYPEKNMILIDSGKNIGSRTAYIIENYLFIGYASIELATEQTNWNLLIKKSTKIPDSIYINSLVIKALNDQKIKPIKLQKHLL